MRTFGKSCEFEPIREEAEKQGQLPGQDLTEKPELDVRIYWLYNEVVLET